jgi:hypothetical protein
MMGKRMRKYIIRTLGVAILLAALVWTVDWLLLHHKVAQDANAFGAVEVRYRFAIHLKNRRIEQRSEKPRMEECVHSMFPHYNESPCWYLARHPDQLEELDGGRWHFFYEE